MSFPVAQFFLVLAGSLGAVIVVMLVSFTIGALTESIP